jgi:hypothetical protein
VLVNALAYRDYLRCTNYADLETIGQYHLQLRILGAGDLYPYRMWDVPMLDLCNQLWVSMFQQKEYGLNVCIAALCFTGNLMDRVSE